MRARAASLDLLYIHIRTFAYVPGTFVKTANCYLAEKLPKPNYNLHRFYIIQKKISGISHLLLMVPPLSLGTFEPRSRDRADEAVQGRHRGLYRRVNKSFAIQL